MISKVLNPLFRFRRRRMKIESELPTNPKAPTIKSETPSSQNFAFSRTTS